MAERVEHCIFVCSKCERGADARGVRRDLSALLPAGYRIRGVDCLAGCDRPLTVGFQAHGKASYLFGDIETAADLAALTAFAHQYQESETGWTSAAERPPQLYDKTIARLPRNVAERNQ